MNRMNKKLVTCALGFFFSTVLTEESKAGPLTFTGQNPAIFAGANPGNASVLLAGVNRPSDPRQASLSSSLSPSRIVEQSVLSQASARINNTIFNSAPGASGSFDLGGGNMISYTNIAGIITLTVVNAQGTTVIGGF